MQKIFFKNDYSEGAHPSILDALLLNNFVQADGYGNDEWCLQATQAIKKQLGNDSVDIHYVSGGTQANLLVLSAMLRSHEAVIAAHTGHIAVHEAGAIEATGHKIIEVPTDTGKLTPEMIDEVITMHTNEHMVKPKVVFVSQSTEVGSLYSFAELESIAQFCKNNNLYLYLDGARLGSGISSPYTDLSLEKIVTLVDVFYIGGTKNGTLLGEAICICNDDLKSEFRRHMKQKGALLAKGRLLGIQFLTLFQENLFFVLGTHANSMAFQIADACKQQGYSFLTDPVSNQIFPILPHSLIEKLGEKYEFYTRKQIDTDHSAVRFVTSRATEQKHIDQLVKDIVSF